MRARVVLTTLLTLPLLIAPLTAAQSTSTPSPTTTATAANNTTTATESHWIGGGGGSGGGGGFLGGVAPSGWDIFESAFLGGVESFANGVASLTDQFHVNLLTLPAAGDPLKPASWVAFDDPYWIAVATVYGMLSAFILPIIWGVGFFNIGYNRKVPRRDRVKKLMWALVLIIGGWEVLMFWFHFWNEATIAFAPSADEFLSTPGNASKLGVGVVLGGALLFGNAAIILGGLALHLMFVLLTFIFVAIWPLSVGLYVSDMFVTESIGNTTIMATLVLSPLQFAKAVVLRLVFEFPLDLGSPETAVTFIVVAIGVLIAFVGIPYYGLKRLIPRSIVATGGRLDGAGNGQQPSDLRNRAPSGEDIRSKVVAAASGGKSRLSDRASGLGSSAQARARNTFSGRPWSRSASSRRSNGTDTRTRTRKRGKGGENK